MAANKKDCGLILAGYDGIIGEAASQLRVALKEFTGDKAKTLKYVEDGLDHIKRDLKKIMKDEYKDGLTDEAIERLNHKADKALIDLFDSVSKADAMARLFNTKAKGAESVRHLKGALVGISETVDNAFTEAKLWTDGRMSNAFNNLDTAGVRVNKRVNKRVKKLVNIMISEGNDDAMVKLLKKQGVTGNVEFEIYKALKYGSSEGSADLDALARGLKDFTTSSHAKAQGDTPYLGDQSDYLVSLKPRSNALAVVTQQEFIDDMLNYKGLDREFVMGRKEFTDEEFATRLGEIYEFYKSDPGYSLKGGYKSTKSIFGHRIMQFKDDMDEFNYLKKWGNLTRGGIVHNAFKHQRRLHADIAMRNKFGPDTEFTLANLNREASKHPAAKKGDFTEFENEVERQMRDIAMKSGRMSEGEETAYAYGQAAQSLTSAVLTGFSAVREIWDKGVQAGINRAAIHGGSPVWESMKQIVSLARNLKDQDAAIIDMLEMNGTAIRIKMGYQNQGIVEDILKKTSPSSQRAQKAKAGADFLRDSVSMLTLADRINTSGRLTAYSVTSMHVDKALTKNFDEMTPALKTLAESQGLDSNMWKTLSKLGKLNDPNTGRSLGVDIRSFDDLTTADVVSFKRDTETVDGAKMRLKHAYLNFVNHNTDILAARVGRRGRLFPSSGDPLTEFTIGSVGKFKNIALQQKYNSLQAMSAMSGLNPDFVTHGTALGEVQGKIATRNPVFYSKALALSLLSGYGLLWIKDIVSGKSPRDISLEGSFDALNETGALGLVGMLWSSVKYGGDVLSTPNTALIEPSRDLAKALTSGDPKKIVQQMGKANEKLNPFGNMWMTKRANKLLTRKLVGESPWKRHEIRAMKEQGQRPLDSFDSVDDFLDHFVDHHTEKYYRIKESIEGLTD